MGNKENFGVSPRKSRSPQLTRKAARNNSLVRSRFSNANFKKTDSTTAKITEHKEENFKFMCFSKTEKKKENLFGYDYTRRPSTASSTFRKKSDFNEREQNRGPPLSKSFFMPTKTSEIDSGFIGSSGSGLPLLYRKDNLNNLKNKKSFKMDYKLNFTEDFEFTSLLSLAIFEQKKIIEMLCATTKKLQKKMAEEIMLKTDVAGDNKFPSSQLFFSQSFPEERPSSFMNSCSSILEEIFQAWLYLFYFIIHLKINLTRILSYGGIGNFSRNTETERKVVIQATECVKFFSKLKIESIMNLFEEFLGRNGHHVNEVQIRNFEEKVLSSFLFEMDFIQKKAKEILKITDEEVKNEIS